jgi:mannose-1-phosphate guanylyltransferase
MLRKSGIDDILVNTHYLPELVADYVQRSPDGSSVTLAHETELLGTAGTLLRHRQRFGSGPVLFAYADNLTIFSVAEFLEAHRHRPSGSLITMMTFATDTPKDSGIVEVNSRGMVVAFQEKKSEAPGIIANAAVFLIEPEVIAFLTTLGRPVLDFSIDVIPHFLGRMSVFPNQLYHRDIGTPMALARAQIEYATLGTRFGDRLDWNDPLVDMLNDHDGDLSRRLSQAMTLAFPTSMK